MEQRLEQSKSCGVYDQLSAVVAISAQHERFRRKIFSDRYKFRIGEALLSRFGRLLNDRLSSDHYGNCVSPIKKRSHSRAAPLPSLKAQTTRLWPRRQSPAAKTFGLFV